MHFFLGFVCMQYFMCNFFFPQNLSPSPLKMNLFFARFPKKYGSHNSKIGPTVWPKSKFDQPFPYLAKFHIRFGKLFRLFWYLVLLVHLHKILAMHHSFWKELYHCVSSIFSSIKQIFSIYVFELQIGQSMVVTKKKSSFFFFLVGTTWYLKCASWSHAPWFNIE